MIWEMVSATDNVETLTSWLRMALVDVVAPFSHRLMHGSFKKPDNIKGKLFKLSGSTS
jgi:hypothetical protein